MIQCQDCKKEYLAIPVIPICRDCGEWLNIGKEEIELLPEGEEVERNETER